MDLKETIVFLLAAVGTLFMLISAVGVLRLPDIFARMHAAGKAATLGVSFLLLAAGIFYGEGWLMRMIVLILLFFITAPISTTAMARAAYRSIPNEHFVLKKDEIAESSTGASAERGRL